MHAESVFSVEPLPRRRVQWLRALRALARLEKGYSSEAIMEYAAALEGDEGERAFQELLADPEAAELIRRRPCLATLLDDAQQLAAMPQGSLGRAYLALAQRDGIRVGDLVAGSHALADERERAPDPLRRWYRDRMTATHDLLHVLTGYDRDRPGEIALMAFMLGVAPLRVFKLNLPLALLSAPKRRMPALLRYFHRAFRRGKQSRISRATPWEELLPLPVPEVHARLGVQPTAEVHPEGVWRELPESGAWCPAWHA